MPKRVTVKNTDTNSFSEYAGKRLREGFFIITLAISLFLVLALATYHNTDPGWSHTGVTEQIANAGGRAGAWFADVFLYIFGYIAYFFPVMVLYNSWLVLREKSSSNGFDYRLFALRGTGFFLVLAGGCALLSLEFAGTPTSLPFTAGGIVGDVVASLLISGFNVFGASLLLVALFLTGITLFSGLSWLTMIEGVGRLSLDAFTLLRKLKLILQTRSKILIASYKARQAKRVEIKRQPSIKPMAKTAPQKQRKVKINPPIEKLEPSLRYEKERQVPLFDAPVEGSVPPLSLLDVPEKASGKGYSNAKLEDMSREVEKKLADFGIEVQVVAVHPGPVITRFELQLAPGLKVSKISGLAKDLARSLSVLSVRIVEVIAGKSVVGLEVPNEHREMVRLSEVLASQQYDQARSPLTLALGKDIAGHPVIVDVAKMPHLLVAGTTGSGKSVAINAMLLSILYKATPAEVRLILVDPKMLELAVYDGIPHLLTPVVTDMKEAAGALRWCVAEMERRYRIMASLGVRNLSGFNNKVNAAEKKGEPLLDPLWQPVDGVEHPHLTALPYILVVIDEFADMMMVVGKKVEQLIARIAQKARAAGIHLILATQRPSVDVITGLIKANVPSRIAFQVSSKVDSRTILDQQGADQLLGHGDMLYLPPGSGVPVRVHGAFVDDHEVHKVVDDLKKRGEPYYIDDITSTQLENNSDAALPGETREEEGDPLYDEAVYFVTKAR